MSKFPSVNPCDFLFDDHGSIIEIVPLNLDAQTFITNNVHVEDWQQLGNGGFAVDHRIAVEFRDILIHEGFSITTNRE